MDGRDQNDSAVLTEADPEAEEDLPDGLDDSDPLLNKHYSSYGGEVEVGDGPTTEKPTLSSSAGRGGAPAAGAEGGSPSEMAPVFFISYYCLSYPAPPCAAPPPPRARAFGMEDAHWR